MKRLLLIALFGAMLLGCVPTSKYNTSRAEVMRLEGELSALRGNGERMSSDNDRLTSRITELTADTARLRAENKAISERYARLLEDGSAEASRMLRQLEANQRELDARSARVEELEALLNSREKAIEDIRRKVADALLGFEGKGLSISTRNGNVYVSMDDKLLFKSGSYTVEPRGADAVRELATVLAQNPDINVMVEGHTDDQRYRPNGNLRDNLDLSVMRATTVTRLLLENAAISPTRIISSGRGEWLPVDAADNAEARARNRRTEIILSPKLDELMELLDR